jgi:hypothetical protein
LAHCEEGEIVVKKKRRNASKQERTAMRMLLKSVEHQVRLAYAKLPQDAVTLSGIRLNIREHLVAEGHLTVEELESLSRAEATEQATQRIKKCLKTERAARRH